VAVVGIEAKMVATVEMPPKVEEGGNSLKRARSSSLPEEEKMETRDVKEVKADGSEPAAAAPKRPKHWAEGKTGGIYVPPFRLKQMQESIPEDKSSREYQRMQWELLKKRINGVVNKVNVGNLTEIAVAIFRENLIRGRGLFCRAILKAQLSSPEFTNVYTALVAIVNSKMPEIGELLLSRVIMQFRRAYRRNDKILCLSATKFIAHLVNQQVGHEILSLQLITLLLEKPTNDSVEVAISFVKECGAMLMEVSPQGLHAIFERMRSILHEGEIDKRVQYMIEALFIVRRNNFADFPIVLEDLDVVEDDDKITHEISLDDELDLQTSVDVFQYDPNFEDNEMKYREIRLEILGDEDGENEEVDSDEDSAAGDEEENDAAKSTLQIDDQGGQADVDFRRKVYLTIMSALSYEECAHKLVKLMHGNEGKEMALCQMLLECCSQERSYLRFYGLLGSRFCSLHRSYVECLESLFAEYYGEVHRFETNKIRNVGKFFAALLSSDSMPWSIFELVSLNEEETTSSSRIFLKVLFQELASTLGVENLNKRFRDEDLLPYYRGLFPKDNPQNTRFAINYFTSIGLGAVTDDLREHFKSMPKFVVPQLSAPSEGSSSSSSGSSASSSSSSSSSDGSNSSSSSSSASSSASSASAASSAASPTPAEERNESQKQRTDRNEEKLAAIRDLDERRGRQRRENGHSPPPRQPPRYERKRDFRIERPPAGRGRGLTKPAWMKEEEEKRRPSRVQRSRSRTPPRRFSREHDRRAQRRPNFRRHSSRRSRSRTPPPRPRRGPRGSSRSLSPRDRRGKDTGRRDSPARRYRSLSSSRDSRSPLPGRRDSRSPPPRRRDSRSPPLRRRDSRSPPLRRRDSRSPPPRRRDSLSPPRKSLSARRRTSSSRSSSTGRSLSSSRSRSS